MRAATLLAWLLAGCWEAEEQRRLRRVWEMQDHEVDAIVARDALARGDLAAAREAGARLAEPDEVPGLPASAEPWLASVRAGGDALAREVDAPSAAARLLAITGDCAGCHRELAVDAPQPFGRSGLELAWMGLVFESEERWSAGVRSLGEPADLATAPGWPARRVAFARRLVVAADRTLGDAR